MITEPSRCRGVRILPVGVCAAPGRAAVGGSVLITAAMLVSPTGGVNPHPVVSCAAYRW